MNLTSAATAIANTAFSMAKGKLSGKEKKDLIFGDGELKKARLQYKSTTMGVNVDIPVQFNPSEYSISRKCSFGGSKAEGEGSAISKNVSPDDLSSTSSSLATLSVTLTLDTATDFPDYMVKAGTKKFIESDNELADILDDLALIMKVYPKTHTQSPVHFIWGTMDFYGHISQMNIAYKMFNRNGQPVRAEVSLQILGEQKSVLNAIGEKPKESPDRTKIRNIQQKDELWMLAADEYDDPSQWKEIAKANGILNPRKVDYTKGLKVPSI